MPILDLLAGVLIRNGLVTAFAFIGLVIWLSYLVSARLTRGRVHGSAIAILAGLVLAWWGGVVTGGERGIADIPVLAGVGIMGGAMLRDFAIVATAFGVRFDEIRRAGIGAAISLLAGVMVSFVVGAAVAWAFGYRDSVSMTTIGAGAATYIVGPVTGTAIGASSEVGWSLTRSRRSPPRGSIAVISPTAWIMPVNMFFRFSVCQSPRCPGTTVKRQSSPICRASVIFSGTFSAIRSRGSDNNGRARSPNSAGAM